jgi:5-formyltetrahydrofolate cyclo-ligase
MTTKAEQRQLAYAARQAQPDKDAVSERICQRLMQLPVYQVASTVMWYVHCRSEVRTLPTIQRALQTGQRLVVPYCTVDEEGEPRLGLWALQNLDELQKGAWGIPEPPRARWHDPEHRVEVEALDVIVVPGVAFDREGGRLGNGAGYYDRLLARVRLDCRLIGIAYEAQLLAKLDRAVHDVDMDLVVTEASIYSGRGRR